MNKDSILLSQIRVMDAKRLTHKMASLGGDWFLKIKEKIKRDDLGFTLNIN